MTKTHAWFSRFRREIFSALAIAIASSISFAAGYLANGEYSHAPIVIEACSDVARKMIGQ